MKFLRTSYKRGMAFFLALVLSVLPSVTVTTAYASETDNLPSEKNEDNKVSASDITKDISEKDFTIMTLEGIFYQPDKETVVLKEVKNETGGEFEPGKAGTYTASYLVTPKDKTEAYTISRNIILTDTEGLAKTSENGGQKQKDNTSDETEEGDSKDEIPSVEVTETEENSGGKTVEKLEEEIENGEVLLFSTNAGVAGRSTATLVKGETLYYPENIGNYLTCYFTVNGKVAYCIESHKASPPDGEYVAQVLDSNKRLQKVLFYGYGGAGDVTGSYMPDFTWELKYIFTHIAASYAYAGDAGFAGCSIENLRNAGVIDYIDYLFSLEEPPKGELSFSKSSVTAKRSGDIQKTDDITLSGDHRNSITINVPSGITCVNKSKNTTSSKGSVKISGGDTFYFTAPLTITGELVTGKLYGTIRDTWRTLVLTTGDSTQDIGVFESETAQPVSLKVKWLDMARVELFKKDAETKNPLPGAEYGIYKDKNCSDLLLTITTDNDGRAMTDYFDSKIKTVYVKEITAPTNYVKSDKVFKVDVEAGKAVLVETEDKRVVGEIYVSKIDEETGSFISQGDSELAGAVYGLYAKKDISHPDDKTGVLYPAGTLIAQGTISAKGIMNFKNLYLGEMYLKEMVPPKGYTLDTTEYDATLTYGGQEKEVVTKNITVQEKVKKQAFELIKVSEDGEQTEIEAVEGAGFKVYLISQLSKVKDGTFKPSNGSDFTADDFIAYDFEDESVAVIYEHNEAVPVPEIFTDKKGYVCSPELPFGAYVVVESTVPKDLKAINPFIVNITEDNRTPQSWRIFDDRPYQFLLKIVKQDAQTGETVLGKQAYYKIYDCDKEQYVSQVVYYPKKEVIDTFVTNEEGYLITPEKLKSGRYRIEEVKAPANYVRCGFEKALIEKGKEISLLSVTDRGAYEEKPKTAIEISIDSNTACEIDPDKGIPIVTVIQPNNEQVGSITITKKGEQLVGVSGDSIIESVKGFLKKIKEKVSGNQETDKLYYKFDYEEELVTGAEFELRAKDTIYSPDGAVDESGERLVRYQAGDLVATLVTDKGKATINNLPLGNYTIEETKAGENLVLNPEIKEITLSADDDTVAVTYENVTYVNERQKISLSVEKKDSISKKPLAGVVFGLYTSEDIMSVKADTLIEEKATDESGNVTFVSDLPHGSYYIKETKHLPGYIPNIDVWKVEIPYENQLDAWVIKSKEIENQPTESHFSKTDIVTGEPVLGATVQVLDMEGNVLEEWITTEEEHVIYALPEGEYIFHEELAPLKDGYVTAQDIPFSVKEDGTITKVNMKDDISKLDISKLILTTEEEVIGAKMQVLVKEDEKILDEWISDKEPHRIEKLPIGETLILREITCPEGFVIAEDVEFTLEDTGEIQKVEMKDSYVYGKVRIEKSDDKTKKPLAGATFEIRNKTTGKIEDTITTDESGVAESKELLLGTYTSKGIKELFVFECVETKAPEGYELSDKVYEVKFELGDGKDSIIIYTLKATNKPIPTQATSVSSHPKTGDTTNIMLFVALFGGSAVVLGAWLYKKKKKA